jgi:hypothetical protein
MLQAYMHLLYLLRKHRLGKIRFQSHIQFFDKDFRPLTSMLAI